MSGQIDIAVIQDAYTEAVRMADAWLSGASNGCPPTDTMQRCYDARLDALQDMMDVLEQKTGLQLRPATKLYTLEEEQPGLSAAPSFRKQILEPIIQQSEEQS